MRRTFSTVFRDNPLVAIEVTKACMTFGFNSTSLSAPGIGMICARKWDSAARTVLASRLPAMLAVRAALWCWFLYEEDPVRMIECARHGQQRSVIDLVKVDKLFLTDDCTAAVIRTASVNNDLKFFGQLISALKYKPSATDKEFCQLLVYLLLSLDVELPSDGQLQNIVDPDGTIFPGIYAFQKHVQRARKKFERVTSQPKMMLSDALQ